MAAWLAATAARRSQETAASEDLAAMAATAATRRNQWRLVATAALPAVSGRAAMAATELEVTAGTVVTAAPAGQLMAAPRLVAVAVLELRSGRTIRWTLLVS